jgi:hypothetical protein
MLPCSVTSKSVRNSIAALLIVAMLCAQWAGLVHRVTHADEWNSIGLASDDFSTTAVTSSIAQHDHGIAFAKAAIDSHAGSGEDTHLCSLFDAAMLGSAIHSTPVQLVPLPSVQVLALWTAFASWQSPFTCHFSSRAPPRA